MSLPLRGNVALIKYNGATLFPLAIIMTDATGEDLTCDVWCHHAHVKQNLQGR